MRPPMFHLRFARSFLRFAAKAPYYTPMGAHLARLFALAALGVVALDEWDFNGLHVHAANGLVEQLGQAGVGAAVAVQGVHCR